MEDYDKIRELLKPRHGATASDELRERINKTLDCHTRTITWHRWALGIGASCAAAVIALLLIPAGMSAKDILAATLDSMKRAENIQMTVDIRTRPMENFRYIDLNEDFVCHRIDISRNDSVLCWKIDKGDRVATGRNDEIFTWVRPLKLGWHIMSSGRKEMLDYLSQLISPEKILENELMACLENSDAEYNVAKKGDDIILTVHAQPQGDFENPYMLNRSITESENIRRYAIDSHTKRLKSASVSVVTGKKETEVLRIISVAYDVRQADILARPTDIKFVEVSDSLHQRGLSGLGPEETATTVLNAFEVWDSSVIDCVIDSTVSETVYREPFSGAVLISVGRPFKSGSDSLTYVPYSLRLRDGSLKSHNLAMRQNPQGCWVVVGGL